MYRVHIELVDGMEEEFNLKVLPYNLSLEEITKMISPNRTHYTNVQAILIEKGEEDASKTTAKDV